MKQIIQFTKDNVALFDCAGDCPDEVAIYENEHYGETIRTPEYCNQCFAKRLVNLFKAEVDKLPLLSDKEIKATSPTAPWYVGCVQCASRIAQAQREADIKFYS